jgi:hypothetical protein
MRIWNKWNDHFLLVEMQNGPAIQDNNFAVSYQKKQKKLDQAQWLTPNISGTREEEISRIISKTVSKS